MRHLFIAIHDTRVSFTFNGTEGQQMSGSNPHNGTVVDAEKQVDYFKNLLKPNTIEIVFSIL